MSSFIWEYDLNPAPNIEWEIIRAAQPYKPGRGNCQLCINEKAHQINAQAGNPGMPNKRTELGQNSESSQVIPSQTYYCVLLRILDLKD